MSAFFDVGTSPGIPVPPAVVGVVVSVFPSTVPVYTENVNLLQPVHTRQLHAVLTYIPVYVLVLTSFTAGCRLMLGPLTAHTFTL